MALQIFRHTRPSLRAVRKCEIVPASRVQSDRVCKRPTTTQVFVPLGFCRFWPMRLMLGYVMGTP